MPKGASPNDMDTDSNCSVGVTAAMEGLSTVDVSAGLLAIDEDTSDSAAAGETSMAAASSNKKPSTVLSAQMKQIKPLMNVCSR